LAASTITASTVPSPGGRRDPANSQALGLDDEDAPALPVRSRSHPHGDARARQQAL
jgi:hypothetical protein